MNDPWNWTEEDLLQLISSEVKEGISLEYKACDALAHTDGKKNEIAKDVSAFANSAGGTIIYGVIENGHIPTQIDIGYEPKDISKEWLEQIINSRIQRRIDGVRINQVELSGDSVGKVAYVVWVPPSLNAPHQAHDKRYYKRFNFQSVPMEEYEVRDVSRRSEAPNLSLRFSQGKLSTQSGQEMLEPNAKLDVAIVNDSPVPADFIVVSLYVDAKLQLPAGNHGFQNVGLKNATIGGAACIFNHFHMNHSTFGGRMPIFGGIHFSLMPSPMDFGTVSPGDFFLYWELQSPRMEKKKGTAIFRWSGTVATIVDQLDM